jgi:hypothetical protein
VGKEGQPRYDRHFCCADCLRVDKRERVSEMRLKAKIGTCPACGRSAGKDVFQNDVAKLHNALPVNSSGTLDTCVPKVDCQDATEPQNRFPQESEMLD